MSSQISRSTTKAKLSIERAGYHIIKDAEHSKVTGENESQRDMGKGRRFAQFYKEGYKTKTPNGLDFVYQNTIADEEIGPIVHSIIRQPRWGYLRFYSTKTLSADYAWFFRNHDEFNTDEPIQTLMVQFWLPGSRVVFYQGSQRQAFKAKEDLESFGIFRTPRSNMEKGDIVSAEEDMPNGGYTIIDSRIGWTYEAGEGFTSIALGVNEEVLGWPPMQIPDTQALRAKVAELENHGFRTNFTYLS